MRLFKKHRSPEEVGAILYESLRKGMEGSESLSLDKFVDALLGPDPELDPQYAGEGMIALMFGGDMAIRRSAPPRVAEKIYSGMKTEFIQHIQEQGASSIQQAEWETIVATRFLEYRTAIEGYSGFEPPWKLGRQMFWNISSVAEHNAMAVKIATLYILEARDLCQDLLNEYGPSIIIRKEDRDPRHKPPEPPLE